MAQRTWVGGATAVSQIDSFAITGAGAGSETWTWTITDENGGTRTVIFTDDGTPTTAEIAAGLVSAWNDDPYAASLATASGADTPVTLTAATAGVPFYVTLAASGTGTVTKTNTTANAGPNDWASVANWAEGAVPVASDDVRITGSNSVLYGLNQSAVELDDFIVVPGCSAAIGSNTKFLMIDMADTDRFEFSGTGRAYIDVGTAAITPVILTTAAAASGQMGLILKGSAIATLDLRKGAVRLESATVTTVRQTFLSTQASDTTLEIPVGCTVTTLTKTGGAATLEVAATTVTNDAGTLTTEGSGAITTLNVNGGLVYPKSSGTITALNADGGTTDFTRSPVARTATTINRSGDAVVIYDPDVVTVTNAIASEGAMKVQAA